MKKCLYCNVEFTEIQKRKVFCSSKCRAYASRNKNRALTEDWKYVIDKNGVKFPLDKSLVLKLAIFFGLDVRMPKKNKLAEIKPKIDSPKEPKPIAVKKPEPIAKHIVKEQVASFEAPIKKEVDYAKAFAECEFPDEYKALWDKINSDDSVTVQQKKYWKLTLGI